jgi:phosphorylcholine metabolism protein LicD
MNKILKFFIILILLSAIVFIVEVMKILTKIYSMIYYIDKDKCFKILCEIDDLCKKYGIKYYLSEGTALGLYRSGDLIDWDDDIDIGMEESQYNIFVKKCLPELISKGYYLTYYYHPSINGYILGFNKDKQLIDIENVKVGEKCISKYGKLCDELLPHIQKVTEKEWKGRKFPVPEESYYVYLYGKDWKIPKKTKNQS